MPTLLQALQNYKEDAIATVGGINSGATTMTLSLGSFGSPAYKIYVTIDPDLATKEIIRLTVSGATVTQMERGLGGTTAQAHAQNAVVRVTQPAELFNVLQDFAEKGWVEVPAYFTLAYVSASSFTLQGDWTSLLSKGDKLQVTNSSTKFFYITSMTFGAGLTTINVTAGTTYTLAVGAISAVYFSKLDRPSGFPNSFDFNPNPTGYSVIPTGTVAKFSVNGGVCTIAYYSSGDGTSNATGKSYTLPMTPISGSGTMGVYVTQCKDSGTSAFGKHALAYGNNNVTCYPNQSVGSWVGSGTTNHVADGALITYLI